MSFSFSAPGNNNAADITLSETLNSEFTEYEREHPCGRTVPARYFVLQVCWLTNLNIRQVQHMRCYFPCILSKSYTRIAVQCFVTKWF